MNPQPIGNNLIRATIRNSRTRNKLAKIPGVRVNGNNVYYPSAMAGLVDTITKRCASKRI
jgi:hypothetical protein